MGNSALKSSSAKGQQSFDKACQSYLRYYANGNSTTARGKRTDLSYFIAFLTGYSGYSKAEKLTLDDWTYESCEAFVRDRIQSGEAKATVARRLATLKHFGKALEERVTSFCNPAKAVKTPAINRSKKTKKIPYERIEKIALQRIEDKHSFIRVRNRMIFLFLLGTGLRPEELRRLKLRQLDSSFRWLNSIRTKSGNFRNIPLPASLEEELKKYLAARTAELRRFIDPLKKSVSMELPLFISNYGADPLNLESFQMGAKTLWRAVNELSSKVELHPHLLRHAHAVELLESETDLESVATKLGHSDIRLTKKYLGSQ